MNAFLPHEYRRFDKRALMVEIRRINDIIAALPVDEAPGPLRQEAEEARQKLFDEFFRRDSEWIRRS